MEGSQDPSGKTKPSENATQPDKKKDLWDKIVILTPLIGTALLSFLGTVLTLQNQKESSRLSQDFQEKERQRSYQFEQFKFEWEREARKSQADLQYAQNRVEELKALTALAPMLASKDKFTRQAAETILESLMISKSHDRPNPTSRSAVIPGVGRSAGPSRKSANYQSNGPLNMGNFLDIGISKLLDINAPEPERVRAAIRVGDLAMRKALPRDQRIRAEQAITTVANDPRTPTRLQETTSRILSRIREVSSEAAVSIGRSSPLRNSFKGVMFHHSVSSIESFKGLATVMRLAEIQMNSNLDNVSWHFAIAPSGTVWLGAPLDQKAVAVFQNNEFFVSILVFVDGDKELPTLQQQQTLAKLLRVLFDRMGIDSVDDSGVNRGFHFHRDVTKEKSCPGRLITKDLVKSWMIRG